MGKYDLIIQNNASKQTFLYTGMTDTSESHLYHLFDVELDVPRGEYTYALIYNDRDDVEYIFSTPLLDTVIRYGNDDMMVIRLLQPNTGLLRIGEDVEPENVYAKDDNNDTIFYYND